MTILTFKLSGLLFAMSSLIFIIFWELPENVLNSMNAYRLFIAQNSKCDCIWCCDVQGRYLERGTQSYIQATVLVSQVARCEASMIARAVAGIAQGRFCRKYRVFSCAVYIRFVLSIFRPPQLSLTLRMPFAVSFKERSTGE